MIRSDDSLQEKLHISIELFQKLTYFQLNSLNSVLEKPPQSIMKAVNSVSYSNLVKHLVELNVSLHAGEYSYHVFESFLRDIVPDWNVVRDDRVKLLNAISRNSATQIISVPIFLGLWRALEEFQSNCEEDEDGHSNTAADLHYSLQMLQLHFVDLHYIYSLIYDRLVLKIHPNQQIIRFNELLRLMSSADIRLTNHTARMFEQSLRESCLLTQSPDNRINIKSLFSVSKSLKISQLDQAESSRQLARNAFQSNQNSRIPSSAIRYVQAIQPKWKQIREFLVNYSDFSSISFREFVLSIQSVGGTVMSPLDIKELWRYVALVNDSEINLEEDIHHTYLPIEAFDDIMKDPEVSYSSLSAIMRDNPNQPFCLKVSAPTSPCQEDHITSLLVSNESAPVVKNVNYKPISSPFPWHEDETLTMSNVKRRIINALKKSDPLQQRKFVKSLHQFQRVGQTLPRGLLREAFISSNIHVTSNDVDNIWDEMCTNLKSPVGSLDMIRWMGLEELLSETHVVNDERSLSQKKQPMSLSSFQDNQFELNETFSSQQPQSHRPPSTSTSHASFLSPPIASSPLPSAPSTAPAITNRLEIIRSLLKNKAQLAFIFRSYGSGSGIITGMDLCHALRQSPFSLSLNDSSLWSLVCEMASLSSNSPKHSVFLRYNQVITFLEEEYERLTPSLNSKLQSSILQKLRQSAYIRGSAKNLLSQLQILRQRLKITQQKGLVTSWEGIPDMCSLREFISLCNTIDLLLTMEEVEFIRVESRKLKSEEHSWNFLTGSRGDDNGVKAISIGGALSFLETLLL